MGCGVDGTGAVNINPRGVPVLASRRLLWTLIAVTYMLVTAAGVAVLAYPPRTYVGTASVITVAWGVLLMGASGVAALGVLGRRRFGYVIEWAACYMIAVGFALYAGLSWWSALDGLGNLPRALIITAGVTAAFARGTYLALEDFTARRAAIVRKDGAADG